jgi:hypothetical protein
VRSLVEAGRRQVEVFLGQVEGLVEIGQSPVTQLVFDFVPIGPVPPVLLPPTASASRASPPRRSNSVGVAVPRWRCASAGMIETSWRYWRDASSGSRYRDGSPSVFLKIAARSPRKYAGSRDGRRDRLVNDNGLALCFETK